MSRVFLRGAVVAFALSSGCFDQSTASPPRDADVASGDVVNDAAVTISEDVPSPVDIVGSDTADPGCPECDENTAAAADCDECGGSGAWSTPQFAYRGVCAYGNGTSTGVAPCPDPRVTSTTDEQTPVGCLSGSARTFLGDARRASYAFQCVEYARRLTMARLPSWNALGGNACEWWANARNVSGVSRYDNNGAVAPAPDDLLVFYSPGDRCASNAVGHIGVVARVDAAAGRVVLVDQNRGGAPAELTYAVTGGRHSVTSFGNYVLKGWLRVGATDLSCGVRTFQHGSATRGTAGASQLVGCPAGFRCDVDASRCERIATCERGEACPDGTRCAGTGCVCDPSRAVVATSFSFDGDTRCFSPGPFVAGAEGCSMSLGVARDPGGTRALYLRDLSVDDPSLISPRLDWDIAPDQFVEVELSCRGLAGPSATESRIYLSPAGARPTFAEGPLSIGGVRVTCDGTLQRLRFPLANVPSGMRRVGWLRLDPLDGERRFGAAEVWVRRISVERGGSTDCGALANCGGRCVDPTGDGANCGACGNACGAGLRCSASRCVRDCGAGETLCSGTSCANLATDATNCGGCGNACPSGQTCQGGACRCSGSLTTCGASCVDTQADANHCGGCSRPCAAGQSCRGGSCATNCGAAGQGCCSGSCAAGLYCIRGLCQQDATQGLPVIRFGNACNSSHWHATTSCYPSASSATAGCTCSQRVTNAGCSAPTCWRRESSFNTAGADPGYGSFFEVFHCFVSGGNRYGRSACAAGTAGDPPSLGWMASSPAGPYATAVYLCRWTASGVVEEFFTTSSSECNAVGAIVGGGAFGYVS